MRTAILHDPLFWSGVGTGISCCVALGLIFVNRRTFSRLIPFKSFGKMILHFDEKTFPRDTKMVLVVRMDCNMERGKIAAQCSHAAVLAYKESTKIQPEMLQRWDLTGQPKVVVKVNSEEEMLQIYQKAKRLGLVTSMVRDAGRTQVVPGTRTVVCIGPGFKDTVDQCTSHLKLL